MQIWKLVNDIIASNDDIVLHKAWHETISRLDFYLFWHSDNSSSKWSWTLSLCWDMHVAETGLHLPLPSWRVAALQGILLIAMQGMLEMPSPFGSLFWDMGKLASVLVTFPSTIICFVTGNIGQQLQTWFQKCFLGSVESKHMLLEHSDCELLILFPLVVRSSLSSLCS